MKIEAVIVLLFFGGGFLAFVGILINMMIVGSDRKITKTNETKTLVEGIVVSKTEKNNKSPSIFFWMINPAFGLASMLANANLSDKKYLIKVKIESNKLVDFEVDQKTFNSLTENSVVMISKNEYFEEFRVMWFEMLLLGDFRSKQSGDSVDYSLVTN